jgi:hypothetical protein
VSDQNGSFFLGQECWHAQDISLDGCYDNQQTITEISYNRFPRLR